MILAGIKPLRSVLLCRHHLLLLYGFQLHQARQCTIFEVLVPLLYGFLEDPLLVLKGSIQALRELLHSLGLYMHNFDGKIGLFLKEPVFRKVLSCDPLHGIGLRGCQRGNDEESDLAALPVGALDKNLGNEEKHALLKVEGPYVDCANMLCVIVKFFLRLQDGQQVPERVSMLDEGNEAIRF